VAVKKLIFSYSKIVCKGAFPSACWMLVLVKEEKRIRKELWLWLYYNTFYVQEHM